METLFQEKGGGGGKRRANESRERRLEKDRQTDREGKDEGGEKETS